MTKQYSRVTIVNILSILFIIMFIDSPQFPRRKVVIAQNQPIAAGFGEERVKLAHFVADQLNNNHKNDAAILEKFRREAQEYKKNLLHRRHFHAQAASQPNFVRQQKIQYDPPKMIASNKILKVPTQQNQSEQQPAKHQSLKMAGSQFMLNRIQKSQQKNLEFLKLLRKKDKQLQKQQKTIKKNEQKLNELRKRVEALQHQQKVKQEERLQAIEKSSYDRIKQYIVSMSSKIEENKSILEQNLIKVGRNKPPSLMQKRRQSPFPSQTFEQPSARKRRQRQVNPEILSEDKQEPVIEYKYKVGSEEQMREQKFGLKSVISNLGSSRNRLDMLGSFIAGKE